MNEQFSGLGITSHLSKITTRQFVPLVTIGMALILVLVAASRIVHLPGLNLDTDEVWSAWQTLGSPQQIISWTPYDWPPLYFLTLGAWKELVGLHPFMLRMFSVLVFLVGVAAMYRAAWKTFDRRTGILAAIAFAALGYNVFQSTLIRGYALLIALAPVVLWLTLNYFEYTTKARAAWLGVGMAALFYTHLTSVVVFALLGLYTLIVYRRRVLLWWLPGLIAAVLAEPLIASKISLAVGRTNALSNITLLPPLQAFTGIFADYSGSAVALWAILFIGATVLILWRWKMRTAQTVVIGLWLLALVALYFLNPVIGFFNLRYLWWGALGLAIWIAWGLSRLPRAGAAIAGAAMLGAMFLPVPDRYVQPAPIPLTQNFEWLTRHFQSGDVMLIDPACNCGAPEEWDYFTRVYFPNGLPFVTNPEGYRRIWYISKDGMRNPEMDKAVSNGRVAGAFVGPWNFLWRLYEAPPDAEGVLFENHMRFHGAEIIGAGGPTIPAYREGQTVKLRLWWSVDQTPPLDYSIGVFLMASDGITRLSQVDGPPQIVDLSGVSTQITPTRTSQMMPGQYYVDEREVTIPNPTYTGVDANILGIYLTVYDSGANVRIGAPGVNKDKLLLIQQIIVKAW